MSKFLKIAQTAYRNKKFNDSILALQQALVFNPRDAASLHLLGIIEAQQGRFDSALRYLDSAVTIDPAKIAYAIDRANVVASLGMPAEAVEAYDRVLAISPLILEAHSNRGQALRLLGRHDEAAASFRRAIEIKPAFVDARRGLALSLWAMEHHEQALAEFNEVLKLDPLDVESILHRGICRFNIRRYEDAVRDFNEIINLIPEHADAHGQLGRTLIELERFPAALTSLSRACELSPGNSEWLMLKGRALLGVDRPADAFRELERLRILGVEEDVVLNHLAGALLDMHDYEVATEYYERANQINPASAVWHYNRGIALGRQRRYTEAISAYEEALARDPYHANSHFNSSLARLVLGDTAVGFEAYEWRWKLPTGGPDPRSQPTQLPKWHGHEDIAGRNILLSAEQGLGDTIMFSRFAPLVCELGARVSLIVPTPLVRLLSCIPGVDSVFDRAKETAIDNFHFYSPLMSLPRIFNMNFDNVPYGKSAYLSADTQLLNKWREILDKATYGGWKPRVGLMWSGRKTISLGVRSVELSMLTSLLNDRIDFISLQKDLPDKDLKLIRQLGIHHFGDEQTDFADAAAIIELVDLVITIDTSIAHLAGGLGKETWIMLQYDAEWRWLESRIDSPWYPRAKLYRQKIPGDWTQVVSDLQTDLTHHV